MDSIGIVAESFAAEMEKIALGNTAAAALTTGVPAALLGAYTGYTAARDRGEGVTDALLSAGKGGLITGGGAAALTAGASALSPGTGKWLADVGRRHAHAVTGIVPKGHTAASYAKSIGMDTASPALMDAKTYQAELLAGRNPAAVYSPRRYMPESWHRALAARDVASARGARQAQETLMQHGVTSLPGFVRAMRGPNRGEVLKALGGEVWHGTGPGTKALIGLGAYHDLTRDTDAEGRPLGVGERVGGAIGNLASSAIPSTMPVGVQQLGQLGMGALGRSAGRVLDSKPQVKRIGPTQDYTRPEDSTLHLRGPEVMMSQSAAGKPYGAGME